MSAKIENLENMALLMTDAKMVMRRIMDAIDRPRQEIELLKYENAIQRVMADIWKEKYNQLLNEIANYQATEEVGNG